MYAKDDKNALYVLRTGQFCKRGLVIFKFNGIKYNIYINTNGE